MSEKNKPDLILGNTWHFYWGRMTQYNAFHDREFKIRWNEDTQEIEYWNANRWKSYSLVFEDPISETVLLLANSYKEFQQKIESIILSGDGNE